MLTKRISLFFILLAACIGLSATAHADEYTLKLHNHKFVPESLTLPANTKLTLIVQNDDDAAAEFESHDLNREKVIAAKGIVKILLGPLESGTYRFYDDFRQETTKGVIVVK